MTTLQQYLGQITIDNDSKNFSVDDGGGADPVVLTTGDYYIAGYTGEVVDQLCEHLQTQIRALGAPYTAATVTYSSSTGRITIDFATGGTNITITWTDPGLQALLGFTGTQSGAEQYTAANSPKGVWRPSLGFTEYPLGLENLSFFAPRSTTRYSRAPAGTTRSVKGVLLYDGRFGYKLLPEGDIVYGADNPFGNLQTFFEDVIHEGKPIRVYPDRTQNSQSDFQTSIWRVEDAVESFSDYINRARNNYNGLWHFDFELQKHVDL